MRLSRIDIKNAPKTIRRRRKTDDLQANDSVVDKPKLFEPLNWLRIKGTRING